MHCPHTRMLARTHIMRVVVLVGERRAMVAGND